jgi:inner membrane protease ATP23
MDCEGKPVSGGFGMLQEVDVETQQLQPMNTEKPDCAKSQQEVLDQFQRDKEGKSKLSLKPEVYLCQEHVAGQKHANTILSHELIHAIDMCRAKLDPLRNCMHLACTEIRAENLSGECNMYWEVLRGRLNSWMGHGQECVRRRAIDSVRANPNCSSRAEEYVDAAMERCYADTFPFERHPNQT